MIVLKYFSILISMLLLSSQSFAKELNILANLRVLLLLGLMVFKFLKLP